MLNLLSVLGRLQRRRPTLYSRCFFSLKSLPTRFYSPTLPLALTREWVNCAYLQRLLRFPNLFLCLFHRQRQSASTQINWILAHYYLSHHGSWSTLIYWPPVHILMIQVPFSLQAEKVNPRGARAPHLKSEVTALVGTGLDAISPLPGFLPSRTKLRHLAPVISMSLPFEPHYWLATQGLNEILIHCKD